MFVNNHDHTYFSEEVNSLTNSPMVRELTKFRVVYFEKTV